MAENSPLEAGQRDIRLDLAKITRLLTELNGTVRDVIVEIGGAPNDVGRDPNRKSIRQRLHGLENDRTAATIAASALDAAKELHVATAARRFSRREKLIGLVLAVVVAIGPYIAPLLHST